MTLIQHVQQPDAITGPVATTATDLRVEDIQWELTSTEAPAADDDLLTATIIEAESYRTVAQQALHELHDLRVRHDHLSDRHRRLADEYRALRERTILAGRAA
jgi:hypothetical protein